MALRPCSLGMGAILSGLASGFSAGLRHGLHVAHRVDRGAVAQDGEVQVAAGGPAGGALEADHLAVAAVAGKPAESVVFDPETFTLDNGMQVVVVTNRRAPVVSHHVWYKVGSADSPPGKDDR